MLVFSEVYYTVLVWIRNSNCTITRRSSPFCSSLLLNESLQGAGQRFEPETCLTAHSYTFLCHKKVKRLWRGYTNWRYMKNIQKNVSSKNFYQMLDIFLGLCFLQLLQDFLSILGKERWIIDLFNPLDLLKRQSLSLWKRFFYFTKKHSQATALK